MPAPVDPKPVFKAALVHPDTKDMAKETGYSHTGCNSILHRYGWRKQWIPKSLQVALAEIASDSFERQ